MKTGTIIKLVIWVVLFFSLINLGLEMISKPNTVENVIGFFIVVAIVVITIKTKALTTLKIRKKK